MKPLAQRSSRPSPAPRESGSALLMALLVLILMTAIVSQLRIGTYADERVARNEVALTAMDQAIESALLEVFDRLLADAEAGGGGEGDLGAGGLGPEPGPEAVPGEAAGGGEEAGAVDSREDAWGRPQRTTINEIELRILVQDEDSKLNVLGMLTEDEDEAELAFERVVRVFDLFREDSREDLDPGEARRLAEELRRHMTQRMTSVLPKPTLLSDDEDDEELGLPLSLRECVVLEEFHDGLFRDYRDETGQIVHSIESFLTAWTSLTTAEEAARAKAEEDGPPAPEPEPPDGPGGPEGSGGPEGTPEGEQAPEQPASGKPGVAVNVNTAPSAVLHALVDDRDVPARFWDEVVEYRNLEEETGEDDEEPVYDEYGEEVVTHQVFDSLDELEEIPDWEGLGPEERDRVKQLLSTESRVFSIYVTARRATGQGDDFGGWRGVPRPGEREDEVGNALVRTVRSVVWRYQDGDEWRIVPLVRWDELDYTPFEVLDYPDDWR